MNKEQFIANVSNDILPLLNVDENAKVLTNVYYKNNDVKLTGLRVEGDSINISPNLYLEAYFNDLEKGYSYKQVLNHIAKDFNMAIEAGREMSPAQIDLSFENIKDRLDVRILDISLNKNRLKNMIYTNMGNGFAATYRIVMHETPDSISAAPITLNNFGLLECSVEKLHEKAFANAMMRNPATLESIESKMINIMSESLSENNILTPDLKIDPDDNMFVVTNNRSQDGATVLWYEDSAKTIATVLDDDFYVLPSSIHEVIVVPKSKGISPKELQKMVEEVNHTMDPEDVLSNKVLAYNRATDRFHIAAGPDKNREEAR